MKDVSPVLWVDPSWDSIFFDLDGTLTDSQEGILNSVSRALAHFGFQEDRTSMRRFLGPPLSESLHEYYGLTPSQTAEAIAVFREYFTDKGWLENAPYPGVEELLRDLKSAGKKLFVATSKPEVQAVRILKHFGLADYFTHISGAPLGNEDGAKKASVIRDALRFVENRDSVVMVGDRRHDVAGAHEVGLPCVGVLYGYGDRGELEAAGADYLAGDMDGLRELLIR